MPFSQQLSFPMELKLRNFPEGLRVCMTPVREIELLHKKKHHWSQKTIVPGHNLLDGLTGDLFHIKAQFELSDAAKFGFRIRGSRTISYNCKDNTASVTNSKERFRGEEPVEITPVNNRIQIEILIDRASVDVFLDNGRLSYSTVFFPEGSNKSLELFSEGGDTKLVWMDVWELKSAWRHALTKLLMVILYDY
ncbi:MAG: GH32 C-terminal domain-containing protein [Planctomycetota bacterium]|jgi:sucrose-6-phosphate hydrolase SacC (GH32 family)